MNIKRIKNGRLYEDTVKKRNGKWTNRGDDGKEHGEFATKKQADAQRKAMYADGYHESLDEKTDEYIKQQIDKVCPHNNVSNIYSKGSQKFIEIQPLYNDRSYLKDIENEVREVLPNAKFYQDLEDWYEIVDLTYYYKNRKENESLTENLEQEYSTAQAKVLDELSYLLSTEYEAVKWYDESIPMIQASGLAEDLITSTVFGIEEIRKDEEDHIAHIERLVKQIKENMLIANTNDSDDMI